MFVTRLSNHGCYPHSIISSVAKKNLEALLERITLEVGGAEFSLQYEWEYHTVMAMATSYKCLFLWDYTFYK